MSHTIKFKPNWQNSLELQLSILAGLKIKSLSLSFVLLLNLTNLQVQSRFGI